MAYNWNKYTLMDKLDELERIRKKDKNNPDLIETINVLKDSIELYESKENGFISDKEVLRKNHFFLKEHYFLKKDIHNFSDLYLNLDTEVELNSYKNTLSKDDIFTITHDYYKQLDKDIYNIFNKHFKDRRSNIKFYTDDEDSIGDTLGLLYTDEVFININKSEGIEPLFCTIHEYAHACAFSINYNNQERGQKDFLTEWFSIFNELLLSDYINKYNSNMYSYNYIYNLLINYLESSILISKSIEIDNIYNKDIFSNNKLLKNYIMKELNISKIEINECLDHLIEVEMPYIFGMILAIEMYMLYKIDKEKALHKTKNILNLEKIYPYEYYKELLNYNIRLNNHSTEYINDIQRKLIKK